MLKLKLGYLFSQLNKNSGQLCKINDRQIQNEILDWTWKLFIKCNILRLELNSLKNVSNINCYIMIQIIKMKYTQNLMFVITILKKLKKLMSSDILKVFFNMNLNRNYAEIINTPILNQLNLPFPQDILSISQQIYLIMINPRTFNESKTSSQEEGLFLNKTFILKIFNKINEWTTILKRYFTVQSKQIIQLIQLFLCQYKITRFTLQTKEFEVEIQIPKILINIYDKQFKSYIKSNALILY
ncbi:unnamed protein product [Paramecium primaurelia]|uniref:Uncharacterized protein n=1 Tax=Paramecium primaurelia TaxID=5886 RepID=A0A8S1JRC1_PARPR|nr:unnamed protein product [Paramecium primaurelia]